MRILYITPCMPWPLVGGMEQRQYHILRALCRLGVVDLLAMGDRQHVPEEISRMCGRVGVQPRNRPEPGCVLGLFRRIRDLASEIGGRPSDLRTVSRNDLRPDVRALLGGNYDLIWVARIQSVWRLGIKGGRRTVLDLDDVEHKKLQRALPLMSPPGWKRFRAGVLSRSWRSAERQTIPRFARVLVCSDTDAQYLNDPRVGVLPNGVCVRNSERFSTGIPGRIIFVGSFSYYANTDGVRVFIRNVYPRIRAAIPHAHVYLVGRRPNQEVLSMHDGRFVHVIGEVADVVPYIHDAQLSVCPIRIGGGTRLKILEAMALKCPVVSTSIGAEGLMVTPGEHIAVADSVRGFAGHCIRLLQDMGLRQQIAEAAFARVRETYSWSDIESRAAQIAHSVLSEEHEPSWRH